MAPNKLIDVVIFSLDTANYKAKQGEYSFIKQELDAELASDSCNGEKETSLVADLSKLQEVISIAKHYNQESILVVTDDNARLIYLSDMGEQDIGTELVRVAASEALSKEAYTEYRNAFYVVV